MELNWRRGYRTINGKIVEVEEALITRQEYDEYPSPPAVPWSLNDFEAYAKVHKLALPMECALLGYRQLVERLNMRLGEMIDSSQTLEKKIRAFREGINTREMFAINLATLVEEIPDTADNLEELLHRVKIAKIQAISVRDVYPRTHGSIGDDESPGGPSPDQSAVRP